MFVVFSRESDLYVKLFKYLLQISTSEHAILLVNKSLHGYNHVREQINNS